MKFCHYPNQTGKGGITLAYQVTSHSKGKTLSFAIAQCSKKDYYCKKTGAAIARKNLEEKPFNMVAKGSEKAIMRRMQTWATALCVDINYLQGQ